MKKILLGLLLFSTVANGQIITDTGTLRTRINADIVPNSTRAITAAMLNRILNGYLYSWPDNRITATSPLVWNSGTRTLSITGWNATNWNTVYNWYLSTGGNGVNIYGSNGTLAGTRTMQMAGFQLNLMNGPLYAQTPTDAANSNSLTNLELQPSFAHVKAANGLGQVYTGVVSNGATLPYARLQAISTTGPGTSRVFVHPDSIRFNAWAGRYLFSDVQTYWGDTANAKPLARVGDQLYKLPGWPGGGGGASQNLQQVLTTGSTLTSSHTIGAGANNLTITSSHNIKALSVESTGGQGLYASTSAAGYEAIRGLASGAVGTGVYGSGSFAGVRGFSTSGIAVQAQTTDGSAINAESAPATTNTIHRPITMYRGTSGTPAVGMGVGIAANVATVSSSGNNLAGSIDWVLSNATNATRSSSVLLKNYNNAVEQTALEVTANGLAKMPTYGAGTHTGTPAKYAAWTAGGDLVETDAPSPYTIGPGLGLNGSELYNDLYFKGFTLRNANGPGSNLLYSPNDSNYIWRKIEFTGSGITIDTTASNDTTLKIGLTVSGGGSCDVCLLNTVTMTATTSFDINLSSYVGTYTTIKLRIKNLKTTVGTDELFLRVSPNNTDFDPGANAYVYSYTTGGGGVVNTFSDKFRIAWNLDENADASTNGDILIHSPAIATQRPHVGWNFDVASDANGSNAVKGSGWYGANQATNYVRLMSNGGNITATIQNFRFPINDLIQANYQHHSQDPRCNNNIPITTPPSPPRKFHIGRPGTGPN